MDNVQPTTTDPTQQLPAAQQQQISSTVDPSVIGQKLKSIYKDGVDSRGIPYSSISDAEIGSRYLLKNGDKGISALGIDPQIFSAQKKKQDALDTAKGTIQNLLDTYGTLPGTEKGGPIRGGIASKLPTQAAEYEAQRKGLGVALKDLAGAGAGSGVRVTQAELNSWANLVPSVHKTAAQNKIDIISLDKQIHSKFGNGLDTQYLTQFGVTRSPDGKYNAGAGTTASPQGKSVGGFIGNALGEVKGAANAALGAPGQAIKFMQDTQALAQKAKQGDKQAAQQVVDRVKQMQQMNIGNVTANMAKGFVGNLNKDLGEPLKGGDIVSRIGENAYTRPVGTALDVLPFATKGLGTLRGATAGAEGTTVASKLPEIPGTVKTTAGAVKGDIAGRAATSIAVPNPESVVKSEALMKDALQTTSAVTKRGMAKELEGNVGKVGNDITTYTKKMDQVIGAQPKDDVLGSVNQFAQGNSIFQAHPDLIAKVQDIVSKTMDDGKMPTGADATSLDKMNEARKQLNSSIPDSWFKNGQPTASATDQLNAAKWAYSNSLKQVLGEADAQGYLKRAINLQHTFLETAPKLSQKALAENTGTSLPGIIKQGIGNVAQTPQIIGARALAGRSDPLTQSIMQGQLPQVVGAPGDVGAVNALRTYPPVGPGQYTAGPIPQYLPEIPKGTNGQNLIRDKRMPLSNPNSLKLRK